ncbi:hypothetical protein [Streptomyces sp. NBC_01483]|uniref:hypothetical protein n=1 Tax=Streptomyces sp. NBC_01483 TaxID=2903883 RepID=UPI002E31FF8C|nr:hypothetical protein [Streptomyces sp. NBC_01483]
MPKENTDNANADGCDSGRTAQASRSSEALARAVLSAAPRQSAAWGRFLTISAWPTAAVGAALAVVAVHRWQETRLTKGAFLADAHEEWWYLVAALAGAVAAGAVLVVIYRPDPCARSPRWLSWTVPFTSTEGSYPPPWHRPCRWTVGSPRHHGPEGHEVRQREDDRHPLLRPTAQR